MRWSFAASLVLLAAIACGESASTTDPVAPPLEIARVELTVAAPAVTELDTLPLSGRAIARDGSAIADASIRWESRDTTRVLVTPSGEAIGVQPGEAPLRALVTASAAGGRRSATFDFVIQVLPAQVSGIAVSPPTPTVSVDGAVALEAEVRDTRGHTLRKRAVHWVSRDTLVAIVDDEGHAEAVSEGTVAIDAWLTEGTSRIAGTAQLTVSGTATRTLTIQPANPSGMVGDTIRFTSVARSAKGKILPNRTPIWTSSAPAVVSISSSGVALLQSTGNATITASIDGASATANVTVTAPSVATVSLAPANLTLSAGSSATLVATILDSRGRPVVGRSTLWESLAPSVATVTQAGLVSALQTGTTSVRLTVDGVVATAPVVVTSVPVASLTITPDSLPLVSGATGTAHATPRSSSGAPLTGRTIVWRVVDTTIADVVTTTATDASVQGRRDGTTSLIATSEGKADTVPVIVSPAPVATVDISPDSLVLVQGATGQLSVSLRDANGALLTGRVTQWTSRNPGVATVSSTGQVGAITLGTTYVVLTSEGKQDSVPVRVTPIPVAHVAITPASASVTVGGTVSLTAVATSATGQVLTGRTTTWTSDAGAVATVTTGGTVTGVAAGNTTIRAVVDGVTGTAALTVTAAPPAPVASVTISPDSAALVVGDTLTLSATLRDAAGNTLTGRTIAWLSRSPAVVTVSSGGGLVGAATGTSYVVATSEGKVDSILVRVSAIPVASVVVTPSPASVYVGATVTMTAVAKSATGQILTGRTVVWSSSATSKATVNASTGVVTGVATGSSTIRATVSGVQGAATVNVSAAPVASITVSPSTGSIPVGQTLALSAVLRDANGNVLTGRTVTWTSAAQATATVSSSGVVTGVNAGTTTVTATSGSASGSSSITVTAVTPPPPPPSSGRWISGYYAGYQRSMYPESSIDFSLLTHILVGAIQPTANGGVNTDFYIDPVNGPAMARTIATRAHQAGRKAILMLGGAGYRSNLLAATSSGTIATFVNNLLNTLTSLGYDGIDIDWEPIEVADQPYIIDLVNRLRAARPSIILTVPVMWTNPNWQVVDPWYVQLAGKIDQMNLMSYQMADNWSGWVAWHQSALYGGTGNHPSSVSGSIQMYRNAGVPAAKLGIGLGFYGSCWRGANTMLQTLGPSAGVAVGDNVMTYPHILNQYYSASAYRWDATAKAGYLSFPSATGPEQCTMVSYEDPQSIAEKAAYVKSAGLGGAIIWTINQGYVATAPLGQRDPLLSAAYNGIVP